MWLHESTSTLPYKHFVQGGSNMTGTCAAFLHTNQSRSYLNHLVFLVMNQISFSVFMLVNNNKEHVKCDSNYFSQFSNGSKGHYYMYVDGNNFQT